MVSLLLTLNTFLIFLTLNCVSISDFEYVNVCWDSRLFFFLWILRVNDFYTEAIGGDQNFCSYPLDAIHWLNVTGALSYSILLSRSQCSNFTVVLIVGIPENISLFKVNNRN